MGIRIPQNPGIGGLDELTDAEELFIQNLAGLSYSSGDILYHDGSNLVRLAKGSDDEVLKLASGVPTWGAVAGSGDVVGPAVAVDSNFAAFDTTTGKLIKDSGSAAASFASALGADDNYVTDTEKAALHATGSDNTITVANEATDTTCFPLFVTSATGDLGPKTVAGLAFNSNTAVLTATGFSGPLTGNVTGDTSGSSGSCTGNSATVTNATLTTALTLNTGTLTLTANAANSSVLTIGAGAVSVSGANTGDQDLSGKADVDQTMYIGTTAVAINRGTAALTLAGITLTTPDIGTPSAGTLTNCSFPTLNQNTTGSSGSCTGESATVATITTLAPDTATTQATQASITTCANLTTVGTLDTGNATAIVDASSKTAAGKVELATTAEINTGTDATRAIPVDQFVASKRNIRWLVFNLVEAATDCAVASNIGGDWVSPIAGTILQSDSTPFYLYATNSTAGVTGTMVVDISLGGTSIMTTNKLDFDTGEKTTTTAATPPDVTDTTIAVGDILTIDIDSIHTTASKGLIVYLGIRE